MKLLCLLILSFSIKSIGIEFQEKPWINVGANDKNEENKNSLSTSKEDSSFSKGITATSNNNNSNSKNFSSTTTDPKPQQSASSSEEPYTPPSKIISKGEDGTIAFSRWYPMCLFMEPSISEAQGNQTVKAMVDEIAQKCKVNLIIFPITTKPLGGDPNHINSAQRASCNVAGNVGNATSAVSSTCVMDPFAADRMCNGDPPRSNIAGCAEIGGPPGEADRVRSLYEKSKNAKGDFAKGYSKGSSFGTRVSIEDGGNCSASLVNHEAIGHSMMGWGHGPEAGYGIGYTGDGNYGSDGWTPEGCGAIKRVAFPNDGRWRWDPKRTTYYVKQNEPFNLGVDQLFGPPPGKPKNTVRNRLLSSSQRGTNISGTQRNSPIAKINNLKPVPRTESPTFNPSIDDKHKKTFSQNASTNENEPSTEDSFEENNASYKSQRNPPPISSTPRDSVTIEYNYNTTKKLPNSSSRKPTTNTIPPTLKNKENLKNQYPDTIMSQYDTNFSPEAINSQPSTLNKDFFNKLKKPRKEEKRMPSSLKPVMR